MATNQELQKDIEEIKAFIQSLRSVSAIPLDVAQALKARIVPGMIWGQAAMSSGSATIRDPRIRPSSAIVAISQTQHGTVGASSDNTMAASCGSGVATISIGSSGSPSDIVNYAIIF